MKAVGMVGIALAARRIGSPAPGKRSSRIEGSNLDSLPDAFGLLLEPNGR